MNKGKLTAIIVTLAAGILGFGGEARASQAERAPEASNRDPLVMLLGTWEVQEELNLGAPGAKVEGEGRMVARLGPGGHSVLIEYATTQGPMLGFALTEVIAREPENGNYSLIWVDAFSPGIKSMRGSFADGAFTFTRQEQIDGVATTNISRIVPAADGSLVISSARKAGDDEPKPSMRLTARKIPEALGTERRPQQ